MAIDYQADWEKRLQSEFGGDRDALLRHLTQQLTTGPVGLGVMDPEDPFYDHFGSPYLSGITAADLGEFFVQPRVAEARRRHEAALRGGYRQALQGAGSRLAREQRRAGLPSTGAITRMEGGIGRPEGVAAASAFHKNRQDFEDTLMSDPNLYAPIGNVAQSIIDEDAKHQGRAAVGATIADIVGAVFGIGSGGEGTGAEVASAGQGTSLGLGAGIRLAASEAGRRAQAHAAKFNPGLWQVGRKTYSAPGSGLGLSYSPFGSNQGALQNLYGGQQGQDDEENYLFGGYP